MEVKNTIGVKNKKWTDDEFRESRKGILARWPTGQEIDLDEAVAYNRNLPAAKHYANKLAMAEKPLFRLECGSATVEQTMAHMQACETAGADFLVLAVDAYTRKSRYADAQRGLEESLRLGKSMLNGFPCVNHGLKKTREVAECTALPLKCTGHCDEEPMLTCEMSFAGGYTSSTSNDLHELVQHSKNYPFDKRIWNNQYVCKLAGYYTERGVPFLMNCYGAKMCYCPPSLGVAFEVIEALTAVEQGVRYLMLENEPHGALVQDIVGLWAIRDVVKDYLLRFGYGGIPIWTSLYSYMGDWPQNPNAASAFLAWLTTTACLAGADHFSAKSIHEGVGLTSIEASVTSAQIVKQVRHIARHQTLPVDDDVKLEQHFIEMEARAIVDKVLDLGNGDVLDGEIKAVAMGVLDAEFSAWQGIRGEVLAVRDRQGAYRYLDHGRLPFSKEIIDYHRAKIAEREKVEKRTASFDMVIDDVFSLSKPV